MKKQHTAFLCKAVRLVISHDNESSPVERVAKLKAAGTPIYQFIRDIVCDSRFYSVTDQNQFWYYYSVAVISQFIDSMTTDIWTDPELRTAKKEDFLNDWLAKHIIPLSSESMRRLADKWNIAINSANNPARGKYTIPFSNIVDYGNGIFDCTGSEDMENCLPDNIDKYRRLANDPVMKAAGRNAEAEFIKNIDPKLVELALKIGRRGVDSTPTAGRFHTAAKSDIAGITVGNNLNSVLPAELALLGEKATENIFYHRYVRKRLQLFASASSSHRPQNDNSGPIYICIDSSYSMEGNPEIAAKSIALAIAIIARRDKRPICLINYSDKISFFILTDLRRQRQKLISFLSRSHYGSNNENKLFDFIFSILPEQPEYKQFADAFKGSDLLIISDFKWPTIEPNNRLLIENARNAGLKIYSLAIDISPEFLNDIDFDTDSSGREFLRSSDFRYFLYNGFLYE